MYMDTLGTFHGAIAMRGQIQEALSTSMYEHTTCWVD